MERSEALEIVRKNWPKDIQYTEALRTLIPELKSEDERIKKAIIATIHLYYGEPLEDEAKEMLAWLKKQGEQKMAANAIREGISHYGITQYQIDNWLKKYVEVESTEPKTTVCPKYEIGDVIRIKNSNHEFIISRIIDGCYHSKGVFIEISIADDVNGDWEYVRHIQPEPKDYNSIDSHFGKSIDKIEPKFRKGEWLCENEPNNYARFIQILETVNVQGKDRYSISRDIHNDEDIIEFDFVEKYYHKFDIQDVKDGDILVSNQIIIIFKNFEEDSDCNFVITYAGIDVSGRIQTTNKHWLISNESKPATKEQRDLLFQKMKEAGYEWDAKKKELNKIEQKPNFCHHEVDFSGCSEEYRKAYYDGWNNCNQQHKQLEAEQKPVPTWSEEDDINLGKAIWYVENPAPMIVKDSMLVDWLKSLKDRLIWRPSDEQMDALNLSIGEANSVDTAAGDEAAEILTSLYEQLKKLKG